MKTITFDYSNPEHIRSGRFKEAWRTATDGEYPCIKVQGLEFDELKLVNISFDDLAFFLQTIQRSARPRRSLLLHTKRLCYTTYASQNAACSGEVSGLSGGWGM